MYLKPDYGRSDLVRDHEPHQVTRWTPGQYVVLGVLGLAGSLVALCIIGIMAAGGQDNWVFGVGILLVVFLLIIAFPTLIAFWRGHPNRYLILVLNLFFATGVTWVIALIWSLHKAHISNKPDGSDGGESGLNLLVNDEMKVRHSIGIQGDVASQLTALKSLYDTGALSDDEYQLAKKRIIGSSLER